ncbi:hypothetical protein DYQ95_10270 [Xanthomonas sp. LMG 9002]|nr:hypothetical protein [Xanthomonas sp. LMG 9002]
MSEALVGKPDSGRTADGASIGVAPSTRMAARAGGGQPGAGHRGRDGATAIAAVGGPAACLDRQGKAAG